MAPIREIWIKTILESIPSNFDDKVSKQAELLIDDMLDVINTEYYYSGRKAILDYVLRD